MDARLLKQIIDRYKAATFTVNRRMNAMLRDRMPEGLTVDQYMTIEYLRQREQCTSSELADIFCVGKSSITAIISRLADKRLIGRKPDGKDRRVTYLLLTEEGRRLADEMDEKIREMLAQYLVHFDEREADVFMKTYEKLANVLMQTNEGSDTKE